MSSPPPQPTPTTLCQSCNLLPPKYTCPGCTARTCSLPCSTQHKQRSGCSGQRNKAAYVAMREYGYGKMVDDYCYLEEVGRRVSGWGEEIGRGGFGGGAGAAGRGGERGRGRGRGRGRSYGGGAVLSKRDVLKLELEMKDIDVDLLPQGMERRKLNQSTWDPKTQSALLTIEFKIYKPKDAFAPSSQRPDPPVVFLTHRNAITKSVLEILRDRLQEVRSKGKHPVPQWIRNLLFPTDEDPSTTFTLPHFLIAAVVSPHHPTALQRPSFYATTAKSKPKRAYHAIDLNIPLLEALKHTHFVEFPTIEVCEEVGDGRVLVDRGGAVVQSEGGGEDEGGGEREDGEMRPSKRRKMSVKEGSKAITGLVGGYGSSEDDDEEGDKVELDPEIVKSPRNGLMSLGEYSDEDDSEREIEIEPAALMELMKKVHQASGEDWARTAEENDEEVDWGEEDAYGEDDDGEGSDVLSP